MKKILWRALAFLITFLALVPLSSKPVFAATRTFTGPGNFSDATKWNGGTPPGTGDTLQINGAVPFDNAASSVAYRMLTLNTGVDATHRHQVALLALGENAIAPGQTNGPRVVTDKSDYPLGATVQISGSGFQPGEIVQLQVLHIDGTPNTGDGHQPWSVTADTNGRFQTTWFVTLDDSAGSTFQLTATGLSFGLTAQTTFTDNPHDGEGTMTVSPTSTTAGSTGNSFTFSFRTTTASWPASSQVTVQIPAGWTAPQTSSSSSAGFVNATAVGTGAVVSGTSVTGTGPWTVTVTFQTGSSSGVGFDLTYGGGGNAVTAPTTAGTYTFATSSKGGSGGTLTPLIAGSPSITVNAGALDHFAVTTPGTQTAGTAFAITTITAQDVNNNTVTSYTGTVDITETGGGAGGTVSPSQSSAFTAGVLSGQSVTLSKAGTGVTITVTDHGGTKTGTSSTFTVNAGAFTKLQLLVPGETAAPGTASGQTGTPSAQTAGTAFTVTVNAVDANWNVVNTITDTVHIASSDTNATLPANAALVNGTQTFSVTLNTAGTAT
ncbi:MAG: hypothetical protein KGJ80_12455, partial [Chloroflexota bacterium]|nr:hypothetical protein [Chloroflexota bacterium]